MRLLLDTQVLLWWVQGSDRLGGKGRRLVADGKNELLWSAASTWELAIKLQIGKLRLEESLEAFLARVIPAQGLTPLPVQHAHAARVAVLPPHHKDPFDRILVAQADVEGVPLLTGDAALKAYDVECILA